MSVDRTPVATPDRGPREGEDEVAFGGDTLSPIPIEGEVSGMDPSAVEALASVHRISPPDGDGDYEEAANSIASSSAFRARLHAPEDEERDYRMAVHSPNSIEHLSHHLPRLKGCPGCDEGKHLHKYKRRRKTPMVYVTGQDALDAPFGVVLPVLRQREDRKSYEFQIGFFSLLCQRPGLALTRVRFHPGISGEICTLCQPYGPL